MAQKPQKRTSKTKKKAAPGDEDEAPPSFEVALERLEGIVDHLEGGDLALEEALAEFEEGVKLSRHCAAYLRDAERKIEILTREGDAVIAEPLGVEAPELVEES